MVSPQKVQPSPKALSAKLIFMVAQYEITKRFDPNCEGSYGHGKTLDAKRSVLHPDLKTIPHQPQVQVIGNGSYDEYEGLKNFTLKHPHHKVFHKNAISEEDDLDFTRFYRWHIERPCGEDA